MPENKAVASTRTRAMLLAPDDPSWHDVLDLVEHDVFHLPECAEVNSTMIGGDPLAFCYREPDAAFLLPLLIRQIPGDSRRDAYSPYGYSGPVATTGSHAFWRRAVQALHETLREEEVVSCFVRLHPLLRTNLAALSAGGHVVRHGETVSVDLCANAAATMSHVSHGHKGDARRFTKQGNRVVFDDWVQADSFVSAYAENMERIGAADSYRFGEGFFARLRELLGPHLHLATAVSAQGDVMGGFLFFHYRGIIEHFLLGVRDAYARHGVAASLYLAIQAWGRRHEAVVQHLGGGLGGEPDSLFLFKRRFSNRTHAFYTWRVVVDPEAYAALCRRGHNGTTLDGYFPAYRQPPPE